MIEQNLLYVVSQLGYTMLNYFSWAFELFTNPLEILGNNPIIAVGFSSAGMSLFFIKPIFNLLFPTGATGASPSDQ